MTAQEQMPLTLNFELEPGADPKLLSQQIASWLERQQTVAESEVEAEPARFIGGGVGEIVLIIAAGVQVIKAAGNGIEELTRLLRAVKGFVAAVRGIKAVRVVGDNAAQDISKLPDGQLSTVAEASQSA
jgi:hypothetical protein